MSRFYPVRQLFGSEWDRSEVNYAALAQAARRSAPRKVDLIFFDAGGGHRASATALQSMLEQDRSAWEVRMVNLREVLEPIDIIKKIARVRVEDAYNRFLLRYGMTLGTGAMLRGIQMLIRQMHRPSAALLARFWKGGPSDLVQDTLLRAIQSFCRANHLGSGATMRAGAPPRLMTTWSTGRPFSSHSCSGSATGWG